MDKKASFLKRVRAVLGFKNPKSTRAVIYARVSTEEQAKDLGEQQDNAAPATP